MKAFVAAGRMRPAPLGARGRYSEPVPVRILDIALAPRELLLVDWDPELLRHRVDVGDIQMNQRVRASVTLMLGKVEPHAPAGH